MPDLPEEIGNPLVTVGQDLIGINPRVACDATSFLQDVLRADRTPEESRFAFLLESLKGYTVDLLLGFNNEWVISECECLRSRFHALLGRALLEGLRPEYPERLVLALPPADRGAQMLPEMPDIVLAAMEIYHQAGQPADAIRCSRVMSKHCALGNKCPPIYWRTCTCAVRENNSILDRFTSRAVRRRRQSLLSSPFGPRTRRRIMGTG